MNNLILCFYWKLRWECENAEELLRFSKFSITPSDINYISFLINISFRIPFLFLLIIQSYSENANYIVFRADIWNTADSYRFCLERITNTR